ncbi:uncharacterized protein LOC130955070 isoform X2 [Arachis stenosperma]|uniref:uncharacterized protein LOC130955070 isoform X2 n=1 Tax=Arachis stenosperma TaxID=217475 RepID=UPI0025AC93CC|nr:uncharacterized protein LOC130955070 isoform X2 [Arachis stenosperma]
MPATQFQRQRCHPRSAIQELHKKRLQLKSKSKFKTKLKDDAKTSQGNDHSRSQKSGTEDLQVDVKESSCPLKCDAFATRKNDKDSKDNSNTSLVSAPKKQKLHWGLDTKERWERKSNM